MTGLRTSDVSLCPWFASITAYFHGVGQAASFDQGIGSKQLFNN